MNRIKNEIPATPWLHKFAKTSQTNTLWKQILYVCVNEFISALHTWILQFYPTVLAEKVKPPSNCQGIASAQPFRSFHRFCCGTGVWELTGLFQDFESSFSDTILWLT